MTDPLKTANPKIRKTFSRQVLELPRKEFNKWRKDNGVPRFKGPLAKELTQVRRVYLSRRYAKKTKTRQRDFYEKENQALRLKEKELIARIAKMRELIKCLEYYTFLLTWVSYFVLRAPRSVSKVSRTRS